MCFYICIGSLVWLVSVARVGLWVPACPDLTNDWPLAVFQLFAGRASTLVLLKTVFDTETFSTWLLLFLLR